MRTNWMLRVALCAGLLGAAPLSAQPYTIGAPTPQYTSLTTLIPITTPNLNSTTTLSGGGQTLTFSTSLTAFNVPANWPVWGAPPDTEGTPARVLASAINQTALTITLSSPANTFGFELEPANALGSPHTLTVSFFNGVTLLGTVSQTIAYNSARLIHLSAATPITSVQISSPLAAGGFALAQFRSGNTLIGGPTPTVPALGLPELGALSLMLAALGALLARRQQTT